jgi:hypothetical protein
MEKRGQLFLMTGVVLTIISMVMAQKYDPEKAWIYLLSDLFLIISTILVIWGIVLVVKAKLKKK